MAQLMPLPLASVKSRLVLPFWYQLTWVVPDKEPLNGCVCFVEVFTERLFVELCSIYRRSIVGSGGRAAMATVSIAHSALHTWSCCCMTNKSSCGLSAHAR